MPARNRPNPPPHDRGGSVEVGPGFDHRHPQACHRRVNRANFARYFSLLVFDGQQTLILASDPLNRGTDLFGTAHHIVNYTRVSTTAIALVQILAIVIGHLLATISAHDQAVQMFPAGIATRIQYPLLAIMVALTIGAVTLVFAP